MVLGLVFGISVVMWMKILNTVFSMDIPIIWITIASLMLFAIVYMFIEMLIDE